MGNMNRTLSIGLAGLSIVAASVLAQAPNRLTLVCGFYAGEDAASAAHERLKESTSPFGQGVRSFAVLSKDLNGRTTVKGRKAGPPLPSRIVDAVTKLAGAPRGANYVDGAVERQRFLSSAAVGFPEGAVNRLKGTLQPGHSAIVAVVDDRWAQETRRRMNETGLVDAFSLNVSPTAPR